MFFLLKAVFFYRALVQYVFYSQKTSDYQNFYKQKKIEKLSNIFLLSIVAKTLSTAQKSTMKLSINNKLYYVYP